MAKTKPELWRDTSGARWVVDRCSGPCDYYDSYDEALAEFERQVELYRQPERKRLLGWMNGYNTNGYSFTLFPEDYTPTNGVHQDWQRAPWLDEPSSEGEI